MSCFIYDMEKMWHIAAMGEKVSLPINIDALKDLGLKNKHIKSVKKLFPENGVDYFILEEDGRIKIFLQESSGGFDWRLNFLCGTVDIGLVNIGEVVEMHAGFYITAKTILDDLIERDLIGDKQIEVTGYSHGAGSGVELCLLLLNEKIDILYNKEPILPECPKSIKNPSEKIKELCKDFKIYIQGQDIVPRVPPWNSHVGTITKVPGVKLPCWKRVLRFLFDHDIYWTIPPKYKHIIDRIK